MKKESAMTKNVAGVFNDRIDAGLAVSQLIDTGFLQDEISVLITGDGRDKVFTGATTVEEGAHDAAKGGLAGAVAGGALGAILAGLTAVGSILVPGSGLLMSGPMVAALAGAGGGATLGGLSGALVAAGFSRDESSKFEKDLKAGRIVIVVHPDDDEEEAAARAILMTSGAIKTKAA
jgi:hypothetical protein